MRGTEHLWHMRQMTAIDPKLKYTTDRYQRGLTLIRINTCNNGRRPVTHCTTVDDGIMFTIIEGVGCG